MSSLVVKVTTINRIEPHPDPETTEIELAIVGEWQCVVRKADGFKAGDEVVYFPPQTVLPTAWTDYFGVTKYCSEVKYLNYPAHRIRAAKLRGAYSFGLLVRASVLPTEPVYVLSDPAQPVEQVQVYGVGDDVAHVFNATKYLPPVSAQAGDIEPDHPMFFKYTDIEDLRNYPDVLKDGEPVVVTEKIHGTSCRVGLIKEEDGTVRVLAGCGVGGQRIKPDVPERNPYWFPTTLQPVSNLLFHYLIELGATQVILFGETHGGGIMKGFDYGSPRALRFRAFDLMVDGRYRDWHEFAKQCEDFGVETVPVAYEGPYDIAEIKRAAEGTATGASHIREGVIVKPLEGRHDPAFGRVILKYHNPAFKLKTIDSETRDV